jgi:hypothetical protein
LLRAAETLTENESTKLHDAMRTADPSGGLEKCWQGREMLRGLLALAGTDPDRSLIWRRLTPGANQNPTSLLTLKSRFHSRQGYEWTARQHDARPFCR